MKEHKNIVEAIAQFQVDCPLISESETVQAKTHSYKYAPLGTILKTVKPVLVQNGLTLVQYLDAGGLVTELHFVASDEKIGGNYPLPNIELQGMNKAQAAGGVITYFRRYAIVTILGLDTEEDNDASGDDKPIFKSEPQKHDNEDKPWLNKDTDEYYEVMERMQAGGVRLSDIRKEYKVNREIGDILIKYENL